METKAARWTLGELAVLLGGTLEGPADLPIDRPISADDADPLGIAFAESDLYLLRAKRAGVGAVLVGPDTDAMEIPAIRVPGARQAFGTLLGITKRQLPLEESVHPTAIIHPEATVAPSARVGAYCVVEAGARIAAGARVYPHCYVGENCSIGEDTVVYPHVVMYQDVSIGARGILHSGCVLGADGFGFAWDGKHRIKVPQVGRVELGDDVEVGACTAIDRATAGATVIGDGTKLDNLVQVGHNTKIGEDCVIAGQTGISGSATLGDRIVMAGGVGVRDHVTISSDVNLAGRAGVEGDIRDPGDYFGNPARPAAEAVRAYLLTPKLPEMFARLRALEKRLNAIAPQE